MLPSSPVDSAQKQQGLYAFAILSTNVSLFCLFIGNISIFATYSQQQPPKGPAVQLKQGSDVFPSRDHSGLASRVPTGGICKCLKWRIRQGRLDSKDVVTMVLRKQLSERHASSPQTEVKPENRVHVFCPEIEDIKSSVP
ncbi:hypothetical protein MG293_020399 [Ovis ammon polii]|uniref:Uncharacterized protein n=1 Tax=Ovis ammon polii TaxID=230172 RepID=A0AAD4Y124_OVIAM|nr:hypothetical protein MG293_020399 [Ovis ammon polii]